MGRCGAAGRAQSPELVTLQGELERIGRRIQKGKRDLEVSGTERDKVERTKGKIEADQAAVTSGAPLCLLAHHCRTPSPSFSQRGHFKTMMPVITLLLAGWNTLLDAAPTLGRSTASRVFGLRLEGLPQLLSRRLAPHLRSDGGARGVQGQLRRHPADRGAARGVCGPGGGGGRGVLQAGAGPGRAALRPEGAPPSPPIGPAKGGRPSTNGNRIKRGVWCYSLCALASRRTRGSWRR